MTRVVTGALWCALLLPASLKADGPRLDSAGIDGALLLCGATETTRSTVDRFVDLAGGAKAQVALVPLGASGDTIRKHLQDNKLSKVIVLSARDKVPADTTGLWLIGSSAHQMRDALLNTPLGKACDAVRKRGGVVALAGGSAAAASMLLGTTKAEKDSAGCDWLPGSLLDAAPRDGKSSARLSEALRRHPGLVGYSIPAGGALLVRGRRLQTLGEGTSVAHLAPSRTRPARQAAIDGRQGEDLTALRRSALDRADVNFPPRKSGEPVVPKGTLIIIGGGGMPTGLAQRFVELAGGKKAAIVVLPTANPDPLPARDGMAEALRRTGAKVTVLNGRTRAAVDSPEALAAMREATGIWFGGGRQWRFVDAYEGTQLLQEMRGVLQRGGVIAGSSAGATIQGDYLCRGSPFGNLEIMYEGYERGLAFLPGVAIDQHFAQRNRFADMTTFRQTLPQYLGIGLDEATAIVVQGSLAEVVGRGKVHFYDPQRQVPEGQPDHQSLAEGERYDLKTRKVLAKREPSKPR